MSRHPHLSYDGFGINDTDEYRTRIATFSRDEAVLSPTRREELGHLFAAAPDLLAALESIARTPKHGEPEDADPRYTQDWEDPEARSLDAMHRLIDTARAALSLLSSNQE
jgi:hypothetical protein